MYYLHTFSSRLLVCVLYYFHDFIILSFVYFYSIIFYFVYSCFTRMVPRSTNVQVSGILPSNFFITVFVGYSYGSLKLAILFELFLYKCFLKPLCKENFSDFLSTPRPFLICMNGKCIYSEDVMSTLSVSFIHCIWLGRGGCGGQIDAALENMDSPACVASISISGLETPVTLGQDLLPEISPSVIVSTTGALDLLPPWAVNTPNTIVGKERGGKSVDSNLMKAKMSLHKMRMANKELDDGDFEIVSNFDSSRIGMMSSFKVKRVDNSAR